MKRLFILFMLLAMPVQAVDLSFKGIYVWQDNRLNFGGFSGLEMSSDGRDFITISDKGRILRGRVNRKDGKIVSVDSGPLTDLLNRQGKQVTRFDTDSEGLAMDASGKLFISFEGHHRVWRYDQFAAKATAIGSHPDFRKFQVNSGMEALAIAPDGTLYTMPERSGKLDRPFPVYRFRNGKWDQPFSIPREGKFLTVGADFGPDGKFYLMERDYLWYAGFRSRIRRFDLTTQGFENEETLLSTNYGTYDNLEGIAAWRNPEGQTCLTMISDDNLSILQLTEFVDYCVVETARQP